MTSDRFILVSSIGQRLIGYPGAVLLLLLFVWMADTSIRQKSTTSDEIAHLTAGYSYWATGDYRLNPENGMLPQRWAALPVYLKGFTFDVGDGRAWRQSNVWSLGPRFLYLLDNDAGAMLRMGRRMTIVVGVVLGLLVYGWSRRLFGPAGAMVSLALLVFSPNVLAHSRLITSDVMITLMLTAAVGGIWYQFHRVNLVSVAGCSILAGLLALSKTSSLAIVPMTAILLLLRLIAGTPLYLGAGAGQRVISRMQIAVVLVITLIVNAATVVLMVWMMHGFHFASSTVNPMRFPWQLVLERPGIVNACITWARDYRLLPEPYLFGMAHALGYAAERSAYLLGEYRTTGWWYFFPYCVLMKTPLGTFGVLIAAMAAGLARWRRALSLDWIYRIAPLLVLLVVYWAFALRSHLNIGYRHILPTLPPVLILAGAAAHWLHHDRRIFRAMIWVCLLGLIIASWSIRPHYLSFFNALAGGPANGYKHLVDSSLDWGQDLPGLKRWLDENRPWPYSRPVYLAYFGTASPTYHGIVAHRLPGYGQDEYDVQQRFAWTGGTYCISATAWSNVINKYIPIRGPWQNRFDQEFAAVRAKVQAYEQTANDPNQREQLVNAHPTGFWDDLLQIYDQFRMARLCDYLRNRKPDHLINYSILVFELSDEEIELAGL